MRLLIKEAIDNIVNEKLVEYVTVPEMDDDSLSEYLYIMDHFNVDFDQAHSLNEAEHRGRKVKLNKPFRTPGGPKKFAVYVKSKGGNIKKVTFGDPNMRIRKSNPDRRRSFRARHNCDTPGPRWKARYWSCRKW